MESTQTNGSSTRLNTLLTDFLWPGNGGNPPGKPEDEKPYYPMGWVCPKCGKAFMDHKYLPVGVVAYLLL